MRFAISPELSRKPALFVITLVTLCAYSSAGPVVSITDSGDPFNRASFFLGGQFSNAVAVSWTQAASFSDVIIDASLISTDPSYRSGTAYLMSAIGGAGITTANQVIPPVDFMAPVGSEFGPPPH